MIDFVNVGKKISNFRKLNNLTQDDLADKLFVTRQALSKWENGISLPSIEILLQLAEIFNTTFDEILCLNEEKNIDPEDIFKGHSRMYIIKKLLRGEIEVNIPDIFYQLSPSERLLVLRHIKENKISVNIDELKVKLTSSELKFLSKKKEDVYDS